MPIELRAPDDFHVHLRQPPMLASILRDTAPWFARVLVMPNTVPPITTVERLHEYRRQIDAAIPDGSRLEPLTVFKVVPQIDAATVRSLAEAGAIGGKLYPQGVTTNSADGVNDVAALDPVFETMEELDLVLEIHAEAPGHFVLDREAAFLPTIERIVSRFPRLRIVIEHVSSEAAVRAIRDLPPTVAATVTVHHLLLTLDDVIGGDLAPHHFCKPVAKRPSDRDALRTEVFGGNPRFFFGSDSAPHARDDKERCGCAGVYTAPVAVPLLAELFAGEGIALTEREATGDRGADANRAREPGVGPEPPSLEAFLSRYGAEFYRLPLNRGTLRLIERPWDVPREYAGVVPFRAGSRLRFDLDSREG